MAEDKRKERLAKIANELFDIANSYAIEKGETGNTATFLHESVNNIWTAQKCLDGKDIPMSMDFFFRSMGISLERLAKDASEISSPTNKDSGTG